MNERVSRLERLILEMVGEDKVNLAFLLHVISL